MKLLIAFDNDKTAPYPQGMAPLLQGRSPVVVPGTKLSLYVLEVEAAFEISEVKP